MWSRLKAASTSPPFDNLTLQFIPLDIENFQPRIFSGSRLNFIIHELWFLFDENRIICYCCRKRVPPFDKNGMIASWRVIWRSLNLRHIVTRCTNDAANMQNRNSHLKLRLQMPGRILILILILGVKYWYWFKLHFWTITFFGMTVFMALGRCLGQGLHLTWH